MVIAFLARVALLGLILRACWWVSDAPLSNAASLSIIIGGVLLVFPSVWLGRKILDQRATASRAVWTTTFVHLGWGFSLPCRSFERLLWPLFERVSCVDCKS